MICNQSPLLHPAGILNWLIRSFFYSDNERRVVCYYTLYNWSHPKTTVSHYTESYVRASTEGIARSHRQSSSVIFPRAALIPPCAATVCDRVGKSLVMHAVLKPASAHPMAARSPAPPAPTTTASYSWSTSGYHVGVCGNRHPTPPHPRITEQNRTQPMQNKDANVS